MSSASPPDALTLVQPQIAGFGGINLLSIVYVVCLLNVTHAHETTHSYLCACDWSLFPYKVSVNSM
uniref:Uncharacterized protein n=1 Tax=Kalanchoe fedtschenkoi TaxID=63787 RepID=A0A7N0UE35_KALFE